MCQIGYKMCNHGEYDVGKSTPIHFQNEKRKQNTENLTCCLPNTVEFSGFLEAHHGGGHT